MSTDRDIALTHRIAALLLDYPDAALRERLPQLSAAAAELPDRLGAGPRAVAERLAATDPLVAQQHYVATFDLRRRCCPYLSYWTAGDTRNRGRALLEFQHVYREAGIEPPESELPDHLAVVLEFAATADQRRGTALLINHHAALELLASALRDQGTDYARIVEAVLATLPAPTAETLRRARSIAAAGPAQESVGLDGAPPYGGAASDEVGARR
ncbi:nitrate reductase molybdenum cofactor assembly chaperone [Saccharopolyspora montiporae]|uniref:nitrate reductase molybdenum cofactor assembly chaperone n=1 Tax=Saccharopolyspora montiporae TaxID=2781240 RepID=UPI00351BFEA7